jgi:hypothetical protein
VSAFALSGLIAAAKGVTAAAAAVISLSMAPPAPPPNPVISHDFADPGILYADGVYYAYSTMSTYGTALWHVPVARASRAAGRWTLVRDAMPRLPAWVDHSSANFWATDVSTRRGAYLLYFTARSAKARVQCLGTATATSPTGPFHAAPRPLVCRPHNTTVDAIDPAAFVDSDGTSYLLYSSEAHKGRTSRTAIWLQQTTPDGRQVHGIPRRLIVADRRDEAHIVEAPALIRHHNRYVLFYSGNAFNSGHYFVNYATATALRHRFHQHRAQLLNSAKLNDAYRNPGGADVLSPPHDDLLVFHAYTGARTRSMFAVGLHWSRHSRPQLKLETHQPVLPQTRKASAREVSIRTPPTYSRPAHAFRRPAHACPRHKA